MKKNIISLLQNGVITINDLSEELKNDKEIILSVVKINGLLLEFASDELKSDKEVVLAALKNDKNALEYVSDKMKSDIDVFLLTDSSSTSYLHGINWYDKIGKEQFQEYINLDINFEDKILETNQNINEGFHQLNDDSSNFSSDNYSENKSFILFFDTETNGLPKNWQASVDELENWPRLIQLAYVVYDLEGNIIFSSNEIVKPIGFNIPDDVSKIHGITNEIAFNEGLPITQVLERFLKYLSVSNVLVAHNMAYDEKVMGSELLRHGYQNSLEDKEKICTMLASVDVCKIKGTYGFKWPKLEELYYHLFNKQFDGAHNALNDVQATAKCFWELVNIKKINVPDSVKNNLTKDNSITQQSYELIIDKINYAIKFKKAVYLKYKNNNGEISERILRNINYSINKLPDNEIKFYNITDDYITGFCSKNFEQRTFNINRIITLNVIQINPKLVDIDELNIPSLIPCSRNGVKKIVDRSTLETVLVQKGNYDKIKFYNYFTNNTMLLEKDGKKTFYNKHSNFNDLVWYDHFQKIDENYAIVKLNSKHRIINVSDPNYSNDYWFDYITIGTNIANYQFDVYFDLTPKRAIFMNFGKWGIIDFQNKIIVDPKFDKIYQLNKQLLLICRGEKWGLFDLITLNWFTNLYYDEFITYSSPFLILKVKEKFVLYDTRTMNIVFDQFAKISFDDEYFILTDFNNKCGIYAPVQNYQSSCSWNKINHFDGKYVYFEENHKKGCFDTVSGITIGEPIFNNFSCFYSEISKVQIEDQLFFLTKDGKLEEHNLPTFNGAICIEYGPITIFQINNEHSTDFKIFLGNILTKNLNFIREDNHRGKSHVKIEMRKSKKDEELYFCISERVFWNIDKYGNTTFSPKLFFSLTKDKIESDNFYSGIEINKNGWKVSELIQNKDTNNSDLNFAITELENTNWNLDDNIENNDSRKIYFKDELVFEFTCESVKFGPFINGISELDVCHWADHEGYCGHYYGFLDINGNYYFDYANEVYDPKLLDDNTNNTNLDIFNLEDDDLPF